MEIILDDTFRHRKEKEDINNSDSAEQAEEDINRGVYMAPYADGMYPLAFKWDLKVNEAPGASVPILHMGRCCLSPEKKEPYRDFDPDYLYEPVTRHETIKMSLAKVSPQDLLTEGAEISNAYLYGDLDQPLIMHQPTNYSRNLSKQNLVPLVEKSLSGHHAAGQI